MARAVGEKGMSVVTKKTAWILAWLACAPGVALAQPRELEPASFLVFPLFDWTAGKDTLVTITNTNGDFTPCAAGGRRGDILAHFVYIDGTNGREANRSELLAPNDTLTVLVSAQLVGFRKGYLLVAARDPVTGREVDFDHLVGDALVVDATNAALWDYPAIGFQCLASASSAAAFDGCGRAFADLDGDGRLAMDGVEFEAFPATLVAPLLLQERPPVSSRLVVISPLASVRIDLRVTNNVGTPVAVAQNFAFQLDGTLGSLAARSRNLGGDPFELTTPTGRSIQCGWLEISADGPILGIFAQFVRGSVFGASADVLAHHGTRSGFFGTFQ
jgi:hypothetical protein